MSILSISKLCKSFGFLKVADEISFDVPAGQALGIIGPNGAGKSTLFNLITGNIPSDGGQIFFQNEDITQVSPMKRTLSGIGR
ncbi:MAG: ATP-binding cassette domain-containing protein, partial [Rhodobacteraceae bacterium]|nr:ATP-binding cassette domain-containing protein [Paracoccaceae bacterium]